MQADKSLGQKLASRLNVKPSMWWMHIEMIFMDQIRVYEQKDAVMLMQKLMW